MAAYTVAGYAAFSGRQVVGFDYNLDVLLETMAETFDLDALSVRCVTQAVADAIQDGEDCLDVTLVDHGAHGKVYDLAD